MALSEEARRLMAKKAGRDVPDEPPPPPSDDPDADENVSPEELARRLGFRERANREQERLDKASDPEYWIALCFRHPDDPSRFLAALNLKVEGRLIPGPEFAAATVGRAQKRTAKDRARALLAARGMGANETVAGRMKDGGVPDPLAGVKYTGDVRLDSKAELDAILAAFKAPPRTDFVRIHDSPYWLCVHFESRAAKEEYLGQTSLDVLGDKYLDGNRAAETLHVDL